LAGKQSFNGLSLHHIGENKNPYEQAISIIGNTLSHFDEDNLIPCFGFGDGKFCSWILKFRTNFCVLTIPTDTFL
jgi:Copine